MSLPDSRRRPRSRAARVGIAAAGFAAFVGVVAAVVLPSGGSRVLAPVALPSSGSRVLAANSGCDRTASPASFASELSAAAAGQTICLASGDYGTWQGTDKAITVKAAAGAAPAMRVSFAAGAGGFTLEGMTAMGGTIKDGARQITIRDSTFAAPIDVEGAVANIVLDHDRFDWDAVSVADGPDSKIFAGVRGSVAAPALTVKGNDIENGDLDGVHLGGSGVLVLDNTIKNLCDRNVNHTDNIQLVGGTQIRIAGNYIDEGQHCPTQGITSFDGGTLGVVIEDNVVDIPRDWGIELYSDRNSIVRHNTVVWHPNSYSEFGTGTGQIAIDRKSQDPAGTGTQVDDNIATSVGFANGSSGTARGNVSGARAVYHGPLTSWPAFRLSGHSPVGVRAASDGLNAGARIP